jgi:catechol-2,3-dioxygenase
MKITDLHILSSNLDQTKEFYNGKLGFTIVSEERDKIGFNLNHSILYFHKTGEEVPLYHIAFKAPSHSIPAAIQWLKGKAEQIPLKENMYLADFKNWNAEATYFFDPNGNIMELIDRQTGPGKFESDFTASTIAGICEVGIVTDNVSEASEQLIHRFGLEVYKKQPPSAHFAAVGDDEGLFIVVSKNRNWYPTGVASSLHWLKIKFSVDDKEFLFQHP